jgi:Tfp pilus assembly protein PilO
MSLILKAKIIAAALLLALAGSGGAYFYGHGKGYNQAEGKYRLAQAEALAAQEKALRQHYEQQIAAANAAVVALRAQKKTLQTQA